METPRNFARLEIDKNNREEGLDNFQQEIQWRPRIWP